MTLARETPKPAPKKEDKPAPLPFKREERAPITPMPKPEQRPAGPVLVKKDEPAAARADEKPAPKRDDKPSITPVTVRGGAVAQPAPIKEDPKTAPVVTPAAPPIIEPAASTLFAPAKSEPATSAEPAASKSFLANKWLWVAVVAIVLLVVGFFAFRMMNGAKPQVAADRLDLTVERNAGQLMLKWNRGATAIQSASRATLTIEDGDHKENVDLTLAQLRMGSVVYTPLTTDVSFRLEVSDVKAGKSTSEEVRALAGRPSPAPQTQTPDAPKSLTPAPAETKEPVVAGKPVEAATPAQSTPEVKATPVVTVQPPKPDSLAARLSAPAPSLEAPQLGGSSSLPSVSGPVSATPNVAAPPPPTPQAQPNRPAAQPPAAQPAPQQAAAAPVGGQAVEARLLKRELPMYPALARQARVSGTVRVELVVGTDGRVKSAKAISGQPLLRQAAVDAVKRWIYSPAMLNGQPTEVTTQADLQFSPAR